MYPEESLRHQVERVQSELLCLPPYVQAQGTRPPPRVRRGDRGDRGQAGPLSQPSSSPLSSTQGPRLRHARHPRRHSARHHLHCLLHLRRCLLRLRRSPLHFQHRSPQNCHFHFHWKAWGRILRGITGEGTGRKGENLQNNSGKE